jgi:hypothetical protein
MHLYIFLFSSLFFCHAQLSVVTIKLPSELEETSGLEFKGNHLLTHNDSGDKARLYEFTTEGKLIKSTLFYDLKNKDWEDLAADDHHYYIADTGNNFATRENLRIYILNKELIPEGTIQIRYEAQKSFSKASINEYDAEALTVVGENLVLFSKNRKTRQSQLYSFPKTAGEYSLTPIATIDTEALITAADYSEKEDLLALTGYDFDGKQYFYTLAKFRQNGIKNIDLTRYPIPVNPAQIEALKIINKNEFWITSESESKGEPRLFHLKLEL